MHSLNKAGLIKFVDMITEKGWINTNTGSGWKAAVGKILNETPADEDVQKIDVKTAVLRYNNLHPGELAPGSLKQYEKRVVAAINQYLSYQSDPTNYKAPARALPNGKPEKKLDKRVVASTGKTIGGTANTGHSDSSKPENENATVQKSMSLATESNLVLPFPLRPNYLAQIVIPRDMTKDEANRLCAFVQALALTT